MPFQGEVCPDGRDFPFTCPGFFCFLHEGILKGVRMEGFD